MHKRRHILEDIKTQLKLLPDFAGVWIQRIAPARAGYPAITVYSNEETADILTLTGPIACQERLLNVSIVGWIKGNAIDEQAEQDMDKVAEAIEFGLTKPSIADDMSLVATDFIVDEEEAEVHAVTLTYSIGYTTEEGSPSV